MPAAEIAVLFVVIAVVMALLGLVALLLRRRTDGRAEDAAQASATPDAPEPAAPEAPAPPEAPGPPVSASAGHSALPEQSRQRYLSAWTDVQERFTDSPVLALSQADALLGALLAERGLPSDGMRTQADLPAGSGGSVLEEFRLGHLIEQTNSTRRADLAQVSVGMAHFRRVFEELVQDPSQPREASQPASTRKAPG